MKKLYIVSCAIDRRYSEESEPVLLDVTVRSLKEVANLKTDIEEKMEAVKVDIVDVEEVTCNE
jgi:hypothetical protein